MSTHAHPASAPLSITEAKPATTAAPAATTPATAATKKDSEKKTIQISFESTEELTLYDKIVAAADADERSPSNYLRIWIRKNYGKGE